MLRRTPRGTQATYPEECGAGPVSEAMTLATTVNPPGPAANGPGDMATPSTGAGRRTEAPTGYGDRLARAVPAMLAMVLVFLVALVPRSLSLDQHATADEDLTLIRSANVALALERRDWWATYQIGHPEVTVQMLVAWTLGAERVRPYAGDFLGPDARTAARTAGYFATLVEARSVMVPVHALLITLAMLLSWRIWGSRTGLVVGLLLALEPFLVAHGRILRTDALLAELMVVAVLAALAFWSGRAGVWSLALCSVSTGLALLTKTPALALLGAVPIAALLARRQETGDRRGDSRPSRQKGETTGGNRPGPAVHVSRPAAGAAARRSPVSSLLALVGWLVGSAAVVWAVWPAMWVRPLRALERMAIYTQEKGGSPMDAGSYFLGAPLADPGPLYYAVALPLRLSPLVLVGLLLWVVLRAPALRQGAGVMLVIGLGLAAALALAPKKADRYILPAIPFLIVVAAVGISALAGRWKTWGTASAMSVIVAVAVGLLMAVWPYPLAAYNPLLGGSTAAERAISVGWGEGLDRMATALNDRPDRDFLTVSSPYPEVLQAQIAGRAVDLNAYDVADYAVRYIAADQRQLTSPALERALAGREPIDQIEIAGIPYAELYALDRSTFVGNLEARQLEVSPAVTTRRGWVTVRLALGPPAAEGRQPGSGPAQTPFVTPLDVEVALINSADPTDVEASVTRALLPDGSLSEVKLRTPNSLGRYVIGVSVRDPRHGAPLSVASWPVGAPRLPDRLVFPSLSVRVQ